VLAWPTITQLALLYVVGVSAVVFGIAEAAALSTRPFTGRDRWLGALSAVVALVFGIALLALPRSSLAAVIDVLAVYLIISCVLRLLHALETRAATQPGRPRGVDRSGAS
jgi:uncharacterized membrane protein HdeD (DUF308 family)